MVRLNEYERIDDLQRNGFRIIQDERLFRFGTDAVLISHFASVKKGDSIVDLGTGNGVIALLLCSMYEDINVVGLELQQASYELCRRNIELNGIAERMSVIKGDINDVSHMFAPGETDVVITNPPYMKKGGSLINEGSEKALSRHEIRVDLEGVVKAAAYLLRFGGRFYMVHKPERLAEIFGVMRSLGIEPKKIRFVQASPRKPASMVLIEGSRGGKSGLRVMPVLNIADSSGVLTEEYDSIYNG